MTDDNRSGRAPIAEDVARLAGVHRSAVSRTFTPGASVAPQTREKVLEAAAALGYRVNFLARSLSRQRSCTAIVHSHGVIHPTLLCSCVCPQPTVP